MIFFFFNDTATTEIYTLSLHDALPISSEATRRIPTSRKGARMPLKMADQYKAFIGLTFKRSEEHTSELQSRQYLVCRLLLEKKKKKNINDLQCIYTHNKYNELKAS